MILTKNVLENTVKPGFSPFPTVFSTLSMRETIILATFDISSANAFIVVKTQKLKFSFQGGKHCVKRRKMLLSSIFLFSQNVFNDFFRVVKTRDCLVEG